VIAVGGFRSYEVASQTLDSGQADFVAMSRPFIREPDLCVRWMRGDTQPATCVSCNRCFVAGSRGGIRCLKRKG
jgi:2,4-dienoyl-CoA reductase-like NADH-dependent reductase (Old Yellow Enzyme family)